MANASPLPKHPWQLYTVLPCPASFPRSCTDGFCLSVQFVSSLVCRETFIHLRCVGAPKMVPTLPLCFNFDSLTIFCVPCASLAAHWGAVVHLSPWANWLQHNTPRREVFLRPLRCRGRGYLRRFSWLSQLSDALQLCLVDDGGMGKPKQQQMKK